MLKSSAVLVGQPLSKTHPLNQKLKGYWRAFPNTVGATLYDISGVSNHASLVGSPPWIGMPNGGLALSLNGSSQYANATNFAWTAGGPITVAYWNYVPSPAVQSSAFGINHLAIPTDHIQCHSPWSDGVMYWDYGNSTFGRVSTSYNSYMDTWTHIALTATGSSGAFQAIYLNGILIASSPNSADSVSISILHIGHWNDGVNDRYHKGRIGDFRIYDRLLSTSEIWSLYTLSKQRYPLSFNRVSHQWHGALAVAGGWGELIGQKRNRLVRTF